MPTMARMSGREEVEAAKAVAVKLCIGPIQPIVVRLAKHTTIRLAPLPLIARVRSVFPPDQPSEDLARELLIARYLVSRQAPTIRPATDIDPGPHVENGCAMTLWEFMPHRAAGAKTDMQMAAQALQQFHEAFEPFDGALPSFTDAIAACKDILAVQAQTPKLEAGSRAFLNTLHARLHDELTRYSYKPMPLHGDAHLGNVLLTDAGAVWADLEATCSGPREWDVASLPETTWSEFDEIDPDLIRCLASLRSLCVAVWCWADYDRSPMMKEAANYHLRSLQSRFE